MDYMENFKSMFINEKLITFGGKRPKYGQVVIMAGGAGSGKGFIKDNLLGIEGRNFDVDALKELVLKSNLYAKKVKEEFGIDVEDLDLRNQDNVSTLHRIVDELKISKKNQTAVFKSIMTTPEEIKPNLIFDVTMKDMKKLINITDTVRGLGYKNENIHIVWVVNSLETAQKQNMTRDRRVNPDIVADTHRGVSNTIRTIIEDSPTIRKYMDGDFWFVFNNRAMNDVVMAFGDNGGSYIKDAYYLKVKRQGGNMMSYDEIGAEVINKIKSYVPNQATWDEEGN